jgi:20S proteasome subunit alpha 6
MRTEAMKSKMMYDRPLPIFRIVSAIADSKYDDTQNSLMTHRCHSIEAQINTQNYGRRPYGVGLLVVGYDVSNEAKSIGRWVAHGIFLPT